MKNKWLYLWLVSLVLLGCQKEARPSPEQVFNDFMTSFKSGDITTLSSYFDEELTDAISYSDFSKWADEDDMEWIREDLKMILRSTEYTILESSRVLPDAVLKVRIETKHYGKLVEEIYASAITKYLLGNEKDFLDEMLDIVEDKIERYNTPYQKEINVYMIYDSGWKLDTSRNEELFDALSGEAYSKIKSFLS